MEEDIKNIEEMLEFKEDIIKYHAWVGTKLINSVENLLTRYKQLEQENKNFKEASIINDRIYKEVCNKNKELEEENRGLKIFKEMTIYRLDVIEPREFILKSKVEEQIKWLDNDIKNTKKKLEEGKTYPNYIGEHRRLRMKAFITKSKEFRNRLQELLRRGEIRCVNIARKKNVLRK